MAGFKQIKIFTDTNIIHTNQAHLLISNTLYKYILEHKNIESVELKWCLPSMVLEERRHQMLVASNAITPKLAELEKLLGHSLGINEEIMQDRVNSKILKIIKTLGIEICHLDTKAVDWEKIIEKSAKRKPPFEISSEKEKGFRDAVIANTFFQEIDISPKTRRSCMLVFISGDKRLKEYIKESTLNTDNVRVLDTLDDLKSLLNAISSEVTEEFLANILPKAKETFYNFDKKDGLYSKGNVFKTISEDYQDELNSVTNNYPNGSRQNGGVTLSDPTFIKKKKQTVVWSQVVGAEFEIITYDFNSYNKNKKSLISGMSGIPEPIVIATGVTNFAVQWQHQVSTKGNIIKPKINDISLIDHQFYEEPEAPQGKFSE